MKEAVTKHKMAFPGTQMDEVIASRFFQFEILCDVFNDWLMTNDQDLTVQDLWTNEGSSFPKYTHLNIPYLSTVFTYGRPGTPRWTNVKLNSNGFQFLMKTGTNVVRHDHDKWVPLSRRDLPYWRDLTDHFPGCGFHIYYNPYKRQVDVKVFAPETDQPPHNILISFEDGFPDYSLNDNFRTALKP